MEPLRLFYDDEEHRARTRSEGQSAPLDEHLDRTERYLADHQERLGEVASVQVAIFLSELSGEIAAETVAGLSVDLTRFPRTAAAVSDTKRWIDGPEADWPDGFWPQFLLRQVIEPGSEAGRAARAA